MYHRPWLFPVFSFCPLYFKTDVYNHLPSPAIWLRSSDLYFWGCGRQELPIDQIFQLVAFCARVRVMTVTLTDKMRVCKWSDVYVCDVQSVCTSLTEIMSISSVCVSILDRDDGCVNSQKALKLMRWFKVSNGNNGLNKGSPGHTNTHPHTPSYTQTSRFFNEDTELWLMGKECPASDSCTATGCYSFLYTEL